MEIVLFTYDRPHWKSTQFFYELVSIKAGLTRIVAAPWRKLAIPPCSRVTAKHNGIHLSGRAALHDIEYLKCPHEKYDAGGDLGIVGGARILPQHVIDQFSIGVLNIHPGAIPANRGLSNIARAIRDDLPPTNTAHLIDGRIDAGRKLFSSTVDIEADDTLYDLGERIIDTQREMLSEAINLARRGEGEDVPMNCGGYEEPMNFVAEEEIIARLWEDYREKFSGQTATTS